MLRRLWIRQNPHSFFCAAAAVFFSWTLIIDLALHRPGMVAWVLWVLLAFCLTLAVSALLLGRDFPLPAGLSCVVVFTVASILFLGPTGDEQSAVSSAQELPILALYLGWFVPRPLGRILMLSAIVLLVVAVALNPLFWADGVLGVPTAVQAIVIALFCFEVGSMLWRSSERKISTDQLTKALNRAGFMTRLDRELRRAQRSGAPLSLVVIDFDGFKRLNDTNGHAAGDEALIETVEAWRSGLRVRDVIGRTGGDEFALLLERTSTAAADQTVRRLRAESPHAWSWGIAQMRPDDDGESIFGRADRALYEMKRGGG